jgi:hypothetical protein
MIEMISFVSINVNFLVFATDTFSSRNKHQKLGWQDIMLVQLTRNLLCKKSTCLTLTLKGLDTLCRSKVL